MRMNPLVVLDADSTAIQQEVIELIAEATGTREIVANITERAMRGELDFAQSLRERVSTLAGTPAAALDDVVKKVLPSKGLTELVAAVRERHGIIGVVSGGFHEVLDRVLPQYDIDIWSANRLEIIDGKLTGKLYGPIIDAKAKAETLRHWSTLTNISLSESIAVGDGANDLEMMAIAGKSVAFNAKPIVREAATHSVDEPDLAKVIQFLDS